MHEGKRLVQALICFFFMFSGLLWAAAPALTEKTWRVSDITRQDQLLLTGKNPSQLLYIPLPAQWHLKYVNVRLTFRYSKALLASSTLTVMANNVPMTTAMLNQSTEEATLDVVVPEQVIALSPHVLNLRLVGYLKVSQDVCDDIENEGNWLTVLGDSTVTYAYDPALATYRLKDFPSPFLNPQYPSADPITLLLPESLNRQRFSPYLTAARYFFSHASWRGVRFKLKFIGQKTVLDAANTVVIGTPKDIHFTPWLSQLPMKIENQQWVRANGQALKPEQGFVYLTKNPAHPEYALLVVSGNTPEGVQSALSQLFSHQLHYLANSPSFYMTKAMPKTPVPLPSETTRSFESLGFPDGTVFGSGLQTLSYPMTLTVEEAAHPVDVHLIYSHSPFLSQDDPSYLMVSVNGKPLNGVTLAPESAKKASVTFKLPPENLKVGENLLEFKFDLQLNQKGCKRFQVDRGWGTIYRSSFLRLDASHIQNRLEIKNYPYELSKHVRLALPDSPDFYAQKHIPQALVALVGSLMNQTQLSVISNRDVSLNAQGSVVWLGYGEMTSNFRQHMEKQLGRLVEQLSQTANRSFQAINTTLFKNAFRAPQDVGFVSFLHIAKQHDALILYGYDTNALGYALALLNNPNKRLTLSGDLAVAFENGSYTSLSSQEIKQYIQVEKEVNKANRLTLLVLALGIVCLIVLAIVWMVVRKWRNR